MPDKYIRVDSKLHKILKIRSAESRLSIKNIVDTVLWKCLIKEEEDQKHDKSKRRTK